MMSESNKQQAVNKLTEIVANFTAMISTRMPDDVVDKLKQLKDAETSSMGKIIYHTMFDNMQKAIDLNRPACQDTGEIMFFVKVGSRFPLLGELQSILKQAVEEATVKAPLRHNAVEIFDEVNTGKNTGSGVPWVTWDIIPDNDDAEIEVYMAGGGCTLPGRSKVLMPSEGYEGVVKFVFENISTLAVNACPPVLVGVGIATSVETAAVLSRKAILRPIGSRHPNPKAAELELRLEEGLNRLGIGPQGLTGNSSVMGVHIESAARHPSTIGVAVSTGCWAHRRGTLLVHADLTFENLVSHPERVMKKILTTPIKAEDLQDIRVGDVIYLTGTLVTCRDVCHRRLIELKRPIPYDLNGKAIFHAGPIVRKNGDKWEMVSVGPTTSMRMESFEREFIEQTGVKLVVGKGGMGPLTEEGCQKFKALHVIFPAGCAVLAATQVEEIEEVHWTELGMPESLWVCRVKEFGPLIVSIDTHGNNLIAENKKLFAERRDPIVEEICEHVHYIK